jgi:serine/threonine-protein kinase
MGTQRTSKSPSQRVARDRAAAILQPGDTLLEYRLLDVVGEGGMGIVFKAVHEEFDDVVAIKCLAPSYATRGDFARRFAQECRVYPQLIHEHIVHMRRVGVAPAVPAQPPLSGRPPIPFIVMDLLEGKTLRRILEKYRRLDFLNTLHVMIQIAEALRFAHKKRIVHRDLKPENVMVGTVGDEKGFVRIMDFGIAQVGDGCISTEDLPDMGTARYMAPEQARNLFSVAKKGQRARLDHRVDIYGFGVVMYELITGQHIFIDDEHPPTFEETLAGHLLAKPTPVHMLVYDCPEAVWPIIERCLAIDPDARYQSFDDVLHAMQELIRDSVLPTHPLGKRVAAERVKRARQAAFAALPSAPVEEPPAREALVPAPPSADAPRPSSRATARAEPPAVDPADSCVALARTVPSSSETPTEAIVSEMDAAVPGRETEEDAVPERARLTEPLLNYVPRANPLPFVPAAAPFVPPGTAQPHGKGHTMEMPAQVSLAPPKWNATLLLGQRPTAATPATMTGPVRRLPRRLLWAPVLALALVLAGSTMFALVRRAPSSPRELAVPAVPSASAPDVPAATASPSMSGGTAAPTASAPDAPVATASPSTSEGPAAPTAVPTSATATATKQTSPPPMHAAPAPATSRPHLQVVPAAAPPVVGLAPARPAAPPCKQTILPCRSSDVY